MSFIYLGRGVSGGTPMASKRKGHQATKVFKGVIKSEGGEGGLKEEGIPQHPVMPLLLPLQETIGPNKWPLQ